METVVSLIAVAVLAAAWFGGKRYWQWRFRTAREQGPDSRAVPLARPRDNRVLARDRVGLKTRVDDRSPPPAG